MSRHEYSPFPSDFVSNAEKEDLAYGLKVGRAADSLWFEHGQLSYRRRWINRMRSYARGEQHTDYKTMLEGSANSADKGISDISKQKNYKIDYSEKIRVLPVFKDILTNAIDESNFKPRAEAIDITAINKKKDYFARLESDFYTKEISDVISQGIGVDISPKNLPKDVNELNVRKLEYKPKIEVAEELAIENVFKHQKFETIKDKVDEDLVDLGIGVVRHYTDYKEGIKMKYVDPFYFIHSPFETDDARDARLKGVVESDSIGELMKIAGRSFSEAELLTLKNLSLGTPDSTEAYSSTEHSELKIKYLVFEYAVHKSRVFKKFRKNKSIKLIDRTKTGYNPSNKNKKIDIPIKVWYEGIYVPSARLQLKWEPVPNQVEGGVNDPISNFVIYAPKVKRLSETGLVRFDSLIQRAIPIVDDLHRDWYKFQQLKMELRPNSVTISPKALNRVTLSGKQVAPQDVLDLFFGRGVLLADEFDEDGEPIGKAIREENGGVNNSAIVLLSNEFTNNYNRLRQLLGVNELRDGTTTPNSKTSVTVQKLLLASSNNATNHIVKGSFQISLRIAEVVAARLYDVLTTKALKNRYMSIIGSDNVDLLDAIKSLPMHKFAIYFDFRPDNEERIAFEQSLIDAYRQKEINVAQYNKARQIRNTKSANKYLEYSISENLKRQEAEKLRNIKAQAEANAQTTVIAEQTKQQTVTIEYEKEKNLLAIEAQLKDESKRKEAFTQELLAQRKHERDMELKSLEVNAMVHRANLKEDRTDQRVTMKSEDQATLIEKRKDPSKEVTFGKSSNSFKEELNSIFKIPITDNEQTPVT